MEDKITGQKYYDQNNKLVKEKSNGIYVDYTYDQSGSQVVTYGNGTSAQAADGKDRHETTAGYTVDTESGTTTTSITDAKGHLSEEIMDAAGLTKSTIDHGDDTTEKIAVNYTYDSRGNQVKAIYENEDYKEFVYNEDDQLLATKYFNSNQEQTLQTDYQYDQLDRLVKMTDSKVESETTTPYRYSYTGYDTFGRTAWTAEVSADAEPTDALIADHKLTYQYDTHGKVQQMKEYPDFAKGGTSCITKNYTYDALDRVATMEYKKDAQLLESYQYKYDKNNHITEKTEVNQTASDTKQWTNKTTAYTYDAFGQLTESVATDHTNGEKQKTSQYTYDETGNRTQKKDISGSGSSSTEEVTDYTYNGLDQQLTALTKKDDEKLHDITYTYDDNGNQIQEADTVEHQTTENVYDVDNRLVKATITKKNATSGETTSFVQENAYNGNGQRISKTEQGKTTDYYYQNGVVSYTTNDNSNVKAIQNLLGLENNVIAAEEKADDIHSYKLYNKDVQGSTMSILNQDGSGDTTYTYTDFGETTIHGSSKNEICYTGGIYDASTGLYYLNARYYDPATGRFLTEDSYRGESGNVEDWHLYVYCANNPINYVDPSGHAKWRNFSWIKKSKKRKAKKVMKTYKKNVKANPRANTKNYIHGQGSLGNVKYRGTNVAATGCGIIAVHNLMRLRWKSEEFIKLVAEFDYYMCSIGLLGITPPTVKKCLKAYYKQVLEYPSEEILTYKMNQIGEGILLFSYMVGAHYVMMDKIGEEKKISYNVYNSHSNSKNYENYKSVNKFLKKQQGHYWSGFTAQ